MPELHPTDGPVHTWFGLSYTNYAVLPRTLMQSMPISWQDRMVACLEELTDAFAHIPQAEVYEVHAGTEHLGSDMDPELARQTGIEVTEDESADRLRYFRDGRELDPNEYVVIRRADPVPHYNRGRTYLEPRIEDDPTDRRCRIYLDGNGQAWIDQSQDPDGTQWVTEVNNLASGEDNADNVRHETGSLREIGRTW